MIKGLQEIYFSMKAARLSIKPVEEISSYLKNKPKQHTVFWNYLTMDMIRKYSHLIRYATQKEIDPVKPFYENIFSQCSKQKLNFLDNRYPVFYFEKGQIKDNLRTTIVKGINLIDCIQSIDNQNLRYTLSQSKEMMKFLLQDQPVEELKKIEKDLVYKSTYTDTLRHIQNMLPELMAQKEYKILEKDFEKKERKTKSPHSIL